MNTAEKEKKEYINIIRKVIMAIESGAVVIDKRGIVYKQEFGEAFLNWLKESIK